jgi:hypothetical protein
MQEVCAAALSPPLAAAADSKTAQLNSRVSPPHPQGYLVSALRDRRLRGAAAAELRTLRNPCLVGCCCCAAPVERQSRNASLHQKSSQIVFLQQLCAPYIKASRRTQKMYMSKGGELLLLTDAREFIDLGLAPPVQIYVARKP